jgi:hypothetical protein
MIEHSCSTRRWPCNIEGGISPQEDVYQLGRVTRVRLADKAPQRAAPCQSHSRKAMAVNNRNFSQRLHAAATAVLDIAAVTLQSGLQPYKSSCPQQLTAQSMPCLQILCRQLKCLSSACACKGQRKDSKESAAERVVGRLKLSGRCLGWCQPGNSQVLFTCLKCLRLQSNKIWQWSATGRHQGTCIYAAAAAYLPAFFALVEDCLPLIG